MENAPEPVLQDDEVLAEVDLAAYVNKKGITLGDIFGRRVRVTWEILLALAESGRLDLNWLITHRMGMDEFDEAISLLTRESAKVMLTPA